MTEEDPVTTSHADVLIGLSRVEGQLSAFIQLMTSQGDALIRVTGDLGHLRDRVVSLESDAADMQGVRDRVIALESTARALQRATTPWYTIVGVILPSVALLLVVAERLYGK